MGRVRSHLQAGGVDQMDWHLALGLYCLIAASMLVGGVAIGAVMGVTGLFGIALAKGTHQWQVVGDILWNTADSFTLVAIPLFILMGEIVLRGGVSRKMYEGLSFWFSRVPGGLLHTNVFGCAVFSALSGSSTATAMTVGTVAIPELEKRRYDSSMSLGSLAAGGCLGILIPPSIVMIVYGSIAQQSVLSLFLAGIVPGALVVTLFMAYILLRAVVWPLAAEDGADRFTWRGALRSAALSWPVIALLLGVIGGMYLGVFTPTEAAAAGCVGAILLAVAFREFRLSDLREALGNAVTTTCVVMFIIVNAQILTFAMASAGIPQGLARAISESGFPAWQFFLLLFVMYLVMGMFLDGISMMLLTVPVLYAGVQSLGFDAIWFGVALVLMIEIGQITPPMGLNLFAIHSIAGGKPYSDVARGAAPYVGLLSLAVLLIYVFPELVLWLPATVK